uniref:IF rod domain-containing protein n=1 Tax=Anolis carolinensis TaxID=28377 RepID=G1KWV8_ANOCA
MQNLNDRFASYLNKVKSLEAENNQLETLIREWYQKHGQTSEPKDYSSYYTEIDQLVNELISASLESNKILLDVDNARMAAEDFKLKYETEYGLRQNVDADLQGLRPLLDKLTMDKSDLEMQYESLHEELVHLKKNHDEVMKSQHHQSGGDVNVEVNSSPGQDLTKTLNDLRQEYEEIIMKNRKEVQQWFEAKMEEARQQQSPESQEGGSGRHQITELTREYQTLEIELQTQLSTIQALQNNLNNTEGGYNMQLQQLASQIEPVEAELAGIKGEIQNQTQEYQTLLGIKTYLEQEINQYRQLLEEGKQLAANVQGGGSGGTGSYGGSSGGGRHSVGGISGGSSGGGGSGGGHSYGGISRGGSSGGGGESGSGHSYGGISEGGSSGGGRSTSGGRHSTSGISHGGSSIGISQGGSSRGRESGGVGGHSSGRISPGGSSGGGGSGGRGGQSHSGISHGGSSGGGGSGGRGGQSHSGISHGGSAGGGSAGRPSSGGVSQGGSSGRRGSESGRQSPSGGHSGGGRGSVGGGGHSSGGISHGRGSGGGSHHLSSSSSQSRPSLTHSHSSSSSQSQSGSHGWHVEQEADECQAYAQKGMEE